MKLDVDVQAFQVYSQPLQDDAEGAASEITLPGTWSPVAVAVDWIGDKIYVTDGVGQKIDVFEIDGRWHAIVLGSNLTSPVDISLDPTSGYMFVADSNQVLRANMDGTNARAIVSDATYKASGVAVDIIAKRVFWCDSLLDYIETVDYQGRGRFLVLRGTFLFYMRLSPFALRPSHNIFSAGQSVPSPSRLTVFENRLFWSDSTKQGVMSVNKYQGANSILAVYRQMNVREPKAVKVLHGLIQAYTENPCGNNNGGCQHMCIVTAPTEGSNHLAYRCACNIGWRVAPDHHNCNREWNFRR